MRYQRETAHKKNRELLNNYLLNLDLNVEKDCVLSMDVLLQLLQFLFLLVFNIQGRQKLLFFGHDLVQLLPIRSLLTLVLI